MNIEDLEAMDIPELAPIEIEANAQTIPPTIDKRLGYFRSIVKQEVRDGSEVPVLTYYGSPEGPRRIPDRFSYEPVKDILRVSVLVPKE